MVKEDLLVSFNYFIGSGKRHVVEACGRDANLPILILFHMQAASGVHSDRFKVLSKGSLSSLYKEAEAQGLGTLKQPINQLYSNQLINFLVDI